MILQEGPRSRKPSWSCRAGTSERSFGELPSVMGPKTGDSDQPGPNIHEVVFYQWVGMLHLKTKGPGLCFLLVFWGLYGFPHFLFHTRSPHRQACLKCVGHLICRGPGALFQHSRAYDKVSCLRESEGQGGHGLLILRSFKFNEKTGYMFSIYKNIWRKKNL